MVKFVAIVLAVTALVQASLASSNENLRRNLQMDLFWADRDVCDNGVDPEAIPDLGPCDKSRFPECGKNEEICYNRKPSRDDFHDDNHQPMYYIQYDRVLCYPSNWGACSSCSPGRYCRTEKRCILDEFNYDCEEWL